MNCKDAEIWISYYLDKELVETDKRELLSHVSTCSACSNLLKTLGENDLVIASNVQPSKDYSPQIIKAINAVSLAPQPAFDRRSTRGGRAEGATTKRNSVALVIGLSGAAAVILLSIIIWLTLAPSNLESIKVLSGKVHIENGFAKTAKGEEGEIELAGGHRIRLSQNTEIKVEKPTALNLNNGSATFDVKKVDGFTVKTAVAQVRVLGTKFKLEFGGNTMKEMMVTLFVISGLVELQNNVATLKASDGDTVYALSAQEPQKLEEKDRKKLEELLSRLGNDDPQVREKAQQELGQFVNNEARATFVTQSLKNADPDLSERLKSILGAYKNRGEKIVYVAGTGSQQPGGYEVWIMKPDGTEKKKLTTISYPGYPTWSPDGKKIIYVSAEPGPITIMDLNGKTQKDFKSNIELGRIAFPTFSPDSKQIAFLSRKKDPKNQAWILYVMDSDGGNLRKLTDKAYFSAICFSPDGMKIAYLGVPKEENPGICVMGVQGTYFKQLTEYKKSWMDFSPCFSPDGNKIIFARQNPTSVADQSGIWVIDVDGSNPKRLVKTMVIVDSRPSFSPSGKEIAFMSRHDGVWGIFVMDADGANVKRLVASKEGGEYSYPVWSPSVKTGQD